MSWFKLVKEGITTKTEEKKETPDGIWEKCPSCKKVIHLSEQLENQYVCMYCGFQLRIGARAYLEILFDNNELIELYSELTSAIPLNFTDPKKYTKRLS